MTTMFMGFMAGKIIGKLFKFFIKASIVGVFIAVALGAYAGISPTKTLGGVKNKVLALGGIEVGAYGGEQYRGMITDATAGDILDFNNDKLGNIKIRLMGVNVPKNSCVTKKAQQFMYHYATLAHVRVDTDPEVGEADQYNRLLGYVYLEKNNQSLNVLLVRKGYAHVMILNGKKSRLHEHLLVAQERAVVEGRGLWSSKCKS